MLRDIALDAFEGVTMAESLAAVDAVTDAKTLCAIAKTAPREEVAARALSRINDAHGLGSIARHAQSESIRRAAFDALRDSAEVLAVALNSEFKDTAVAAVERIGDRGALEQIAARARGKSASSARVASFAKWQSVPRWKLLARRRSPRAGRRPANAGAWPRRSAARCRACGGCRGGGAPEAQRRADELAAAQRLQQEADERARQLEAENDGGEAGGTGRGGAMEARRVGQTKRILATARKAHHPARRSRRQRSGGAEQGSTRPRRRRRGRRARRDALARLISCSAGRASRREAICRSRPPIARCATSAPRSRIPPLPSRQEHDEDVQAAEGGAGCAEPKVRELREADDWQRWANVGVQEQLCAKMERLRGGGPEEIAREVRELQDSGASGRRAARAGRSAVAPLQGGARRGLGPLRGAFRRAGGGARREPGEENRALRESRSAGRGRRTGFRRPRRSRGFRPNGRRSVRSRADTKRRSGTVSALPAIGSSRAATTISPTARGCGPRTWRRRKRSRAAEALAESTDWEPRRPRSGACRPNGRPSVRSRRAARRRSGSGSAARAIGSSPLRAAPRHRARRAGRGARGDLRRARSRWQSRPPEDARAR